MIELKTYQLEENRGIECESCGKESKIRSIAKSGNLFYGIQVGKESGESAWEPTRTGWECPVCSD